MATTIPRNQWLTCIVDNDYEINADTLQIRRKTDHYIIAETLANNGYITVSLSGETMYKHRVIAFQFIPNDDPEHKTQVHHRNHIRSDNRIDNLEWVTPSENNRSKTGARNGVTYEYVDEIDDACIKIDEYGSRKLEGYYYDQDLDQFYQYVIDRYKILHVITKLHGSKYLTMYDINGKRFNLHINKFKEIYSIE